MQTDKVNLYINSQYTPDETNSKVTINIPTGLLKLHKENEYFTVSVNGFYCFSTFYQLTNANNRFLLYYKDSSNNIIQPAIGSLNCIGNPNVYNVRDNLNDLLNSVCQVVYDKISNTFVYVRKEPENDEIQLSVGSLDMYIKTINCGNFMGLTDGEEIKVTSNGFVSNPINVLAHRQIFFAVDGDLQITENNLNNIQKSVFQPSNILFYKTIDTDANKLLVYDNEDSNSSFQYTVTRIENINNFSISVFNQDGYIIEDMPDWNMCLQFEHHVKDDSVTLLRQIKEYLSYIFLVIGNYLYPPR